MKRFVTGLVAATVAIGLLAGPVLALAIYSLTFTAEETLGNEWTTTPILVGIDNQWYLDHGYISWAATETRVKQGDATLPHLVAYDKIAFVPPLIASNSVSTFTYTTGNEPVPMKIVVGTGGYVTTPDNRALDLVAPWAITVSGFPDLVLESSLGQKADSFSFYNSECEVTFEAAGGEPLMWEGSSNEGRVVKVVNDGTYLYAAVQGVWDGNSRIAKIDPATMTEVDSWTDVHLFDPIAITYSATTGFLYAGGGSDFEGQERVWKINPDTMTTNNTKDLTDYQWEGAEISSMTDGVGTNMIYFSLSTGILKMNGDSMTIVDDFIGSGQASSMICEDGVNLYVAGTYAESYGVVNRFNAINMTLTDGWTDPHGRSFWAQSLLAETGSYVYAALGYNSTYSNYVAKITKGSMTLFDSWEYPPPEGYDPMYDKFAGIEVDGDYLYAVTYSQVDVENNYGGFQLTWDDMELVTDFDVQMYGRCTDWLDGLLRVGGSWSGGTDPFVAQTFGSGEALLLVAGDVTNEPHVYSVTGDGETATLLIDGIERATQSYSSDLPTGEGNDWEWMMSGVPWLNYISLVSGGVEVLHYEPITIIPDDDSLMDWTYTQDGMITWGATPEGITFAVGPLMPANPAVPVTIGVGGSGGILQGIQAPPTMYSEGDTSKVPFGAAIDEILGIGNVPKMMWWYPFVFLLICILGLLIYEATTRGAGQTGVVQQGSVLTMCIVVECLFVFFGILGEVNTSSLIPLFPAFLFPIPGTAITLSVKHVGWG